MISRSVPSPPLEEESLCAFCGLPNPRWSWWKSSVASQATYCCSGCRFAAEVREHQGAAFNRPLARLALSVFLTLSITVFTMALWTFDVYDVASAREARLSAPMAAFFQYVSLLITLPVLWLLGIPLAECAWEQFRQGRLATDALLLLGVVGATVYSAISVFNGSGHVYFEVACVVLVLVTLGRWLESTGKAQASAAIDELARLLPQRVRRITAEGESEVPLTELVVGDSVRVVVGERFPTDGVILQGRGSVDQQMITGESRYLEKEPGDTVFSGTLNVDGILVVRVTEGPNEGTLLRLVRAIKQAQLEKGPYQQLADQISTWFLPIVSLIAISAGVLHGLRTSLMEGAMVMMSVVLIACPCALGLATPLAIWTSLGAAAKKHAIFRRGTALQQLAQIKAVAFDKTGALTTGQPSVESLAIAAGESEHEIAAWSTALAAATDHPLSRAIAQHFPSESTAPWELSIQALSGRGIVANVRAAKTTDGVSGTVAAASRQVALGSLTLMRELELQVPASLEGAVAEALHKGQPICGIGWEGQLRGLFTFCETLREDVEQTITVLQAQGLVVKILSGDHAAAAHRIAQHLGIEAAGELLPEDKVSQLKLLREQVGPVVMVGDGVNDAPALAKADVGIALGCGADLARGSADVCLMTNDLATIPWLLRVSQRTIAIIRQNLFWAFVYNALGIGLACAGRLNPMWASAAMVISSVLVIGNSLRASKDG